MRRASSAEAGEGAVYREVTERFWVFELVVEVRADGAYVRLAPLHRSFRRIPASEVESVAVTSYAPGTYGGWHWGARASPQGNRVYRLRGSRGVEFQLSGGTRVFVGSETPSAFADAVEAVVADT